MALIAKQHPSQNWLRVSDGVYRSALERNIALGKADTDHFWTAELPRLMGDLYILKQVEERRAELQEKQQRLEDDLRQIAGGLIEEHSNCEEQLALIDEVLA